MVGRYAITFRRDGNSCKLATGNNISCGRKIVDLSTLAELGKKKVAGVAIGMIVLLVWPMIDGAKDLLRAEPGPMSRLVAVGAFAIGALGILARPLASVSGARSGDGGNCDIASGSSDNKLDCDFLPSAPAAKP